MRRSFAILTLCLLASPAMAQVPMSEPLRVRRAEPNYRWEATSTASRNGEVTRRYNLGQDSYNYYGSSTPGGWYRPTNYFNAYTYRGVPEAQLQSGYGNNSLSRFSGPVPTRWLRRR